MGEFPHDCSICEHSPDHRAAWGCDAETEGPQEDVDHKPIMFHGEQLHRCPRALLRESNFDLRPLRYFNAVLDPHKVLPEAGGMNDQPASWCETMMLLQCEKNAASNRQHERQMAKINKT